MKIRRWDEREYIYNRLFPYSSKFNSLSKITIQWVKYYGLSFGLLFLIFCERVSRIVSLDFEKVFDKIPSPIRAALLSLVYVSVWLLVLFVIIGWWFLGIIIGASITKPAIWSFILQASLSNIYIFLMIFFSIVVWIVNFYFGDYFKNKSEKLGNKGDYLRSEKGHTILGFLYGLLSGILDAINYERMYALRISFYGFISMILAHYFLGIFL